MKRKYILLLALIVFLSQNLIAQDNEIALAKIHYNFVHINDTTQLDKNHHSEMVLYLGQHSSFYTDYTNKRMEEALRKQVESPSFDGSLTITGIGSGTPESYYTVPARNLLQQTYSLNGENYLVDEEFPELNWKVGQETKIIGGYNCQRAETHFKGRDYIAWFTTDIPFQAGPWKLQGLPGLILEAADSKNEVQFKYAGFDKIETSGLTVGIPENTIKTNKKALTNLIEAVSKNPAAAMKASSQGGGSSSASPLDSIIDPSKIKSISITKDAVSKSPITNNPIELED
ncbi:GLPGLI family protein [Albibacterium bauzanense]|uniref:GLPGLI family protein n=1 Tax=Albibacterium bauzanense TaxID=653929 RepID=A0A4R1LP52_9SPHI|nr:GLPGLI family protein [Albibacterium bauzanense]TCK80595.1 GLPGLI family protein [Albibacterium bauzanense]